MGLDIGTTSVKAVVFSKDGKFIAEAENLIPTFYPEANWAEQDPNELEQSCRFVLKDVIKKAEVKDGELLSIGFSSAMHSLICVDKNGAALSNMLIWSDGRSIDQANKLKKTIGKEIFLKTGTPIHPMNPFVKLLWMKENEYEPYKKASYFMSIKEYVINKWFGQHWIDYSMASATGLLNLQTMDWDEEVLKLAGVKRSQLSAIVPPTTVLPSLKKAVAEEIGISDSIPFVIGACDGQLANLGDGAILSGEVAISVGTSGAIRQFIQGTSVNENEETFTYLFTDDTSIIGGATNNGGIVLQWIKDLFEYKGSHEEFLADAENIEIGSEGILFFPYVNGERAPLWNQQARGNFFGLKIGHKREHLVRAVLEGIAFNLFQIGKSLEQLAGEPKRISINGGLSKSDLWVQIMADLFGREIQLSVSHHSAAWGAAWMSLVGIGAAESLSKIKENIQVGKVIQPNQENHKKYRELFTKYEKIAKDLAAHF